MIGFLPEIYPDELLYSWFCRYFAHAGYLHYRQALEDLLVTRTNRVNMEFSGHLNADARTLVSSMYSMEMLIEKHTMFPQYTRFADKERRAEALKALMNGVEDIRRVITIPTSQKPRYMRYCPICAREDRVQYGETYWHRTHILRHLSICPKHQCRLIFTDIEISTDKSPRVYVAEDKVPREGEDGYEAPQTVEDGKELALAKYIVDVFQSPLLKKNIQIGKFLSSQLEGTKYLSITGRKRYISLLFKEFVEYFGGFKDKGITQAHQLQKIFAGHNVDFCAICQLALFLGISVKELVNPELPAKTQAIAYQEEVAKLKAQGLGCRKIAEIVGSSPTAALRANKKHKEAERDYGVRRGQRREDWDAMDAELFPTAKETVQKLYYGNGGRPKRITKPTVEKTLGLPQRRLNYFPKCKAVVEEFEEDYEHYWARECVWAFQKLRQEASGETICWTDILKMTNLRRQNFEKCFPYLSLYADVETAMSIRAL